MPGIIKDFLAGLQEKKARQALAREIAKNLESCYVMQQLGRHHGFKLDTWLRLRKSAPKLPIEVVRYGQRLQEFNQALDAAQDFERWYLGDLSRRNLDNAHKLHDLKEMVQEKFIGLEAVIKLAQYYLNKVV
jgi:hypothetical protein